MKCLECQKEFNPMRDDAKYCSTNCRKKYSRRKNKVVTLPPIAVTDVTDNRTNVTDNSEGDVTDKFVSKWPDYEITPEVEKKLVKIYKQFEKENKGFKCEPCIVKGKRILTEWEKMKLYYMDNPEKGGVI
jgi:CRISPR/Cas system endoribonuclease Cas6 (RAMP superfamily)